MAPLGGAPPSSAQDDARELADEISQMQVDLERSIQIAGVKNDPTLPLIRVLGTALALQSRLHSQAVSYFRDSSDRLDRQLADTIEQAELALETRRTAIVDELAPKIADTVHYSVQRYWRILSLRTVLGGAGALIVFLCAGGAFTYGAGFSNGRSAGENAAHTIQAAMAAGPGAATDWAVLMADNNPVAAMAACRKVIQTDADGRRYCFMPVWLDPPVDASPAQRQQGGS
jgi:hypothetical protein